MPIQTNFAFKGTPKKAVPPAPPPPPVKVKPLPPPVSKPAIPKKPAAGSWQKVPSTKVTAKPLYSTGASGYAHLGGWLWAPLGFGSWGPFTFSGLKKSTRYKIFLKDKDVTGWCRTTNYSSSNSTNYFKERNEYWKANNSTTSQLYKTAAITTANRYNPNQKFISSNSSGGIQFALYFWSGEQTNGKWTYKNHFPEYNWKGWNAKNNKWEGYKDLANDLYVIEYAWIPTIPVVPPKPPVNPPPPKTVPPRNPNQKTVPDIIIKPPPTQPPKQTVPTGPPPGGVKDKNAPKSGGTGGNVPQNPLDNIIRRGGGCIFRPPERTSRPRIIENSGDYDIVQSFFINPLNFGGASTIDLCSVTLYFRSKAFNANLKSKNKTKKQAKPYVRLCLIDMDNGIPNTKIKHQGSVVTLDAADITASADASVGTTFEFEKPIRVKTGFSYAFAIDVSDVAFQLWYCKKGDRKVGTNVASPGPSADAGGSMFINVVNNPDALQKKRLDAQKAKNDTQLKFDIDLAEYDSSLAQIDLVNADYEFFTLNEDNDAQFMVGEDVYKASEPKPGRITGLLGDDLFRGFGTSFTTELERGQDIIISETYKIDTGTPPVWTGTQVNIDSIVGNGTTATVTTNVNHGLVSGESVNISGAIANVGFNTTDNTVTVISDTVFTYENTTNDTEPSDSPAVVETPTGTMVITLDTENATFNEHELSVGDIVVITNVVPSTYNGTYTITSKGPQTITFAKYGDPGTWVSGGWVTDIASQEVYEVINILSDTRLETNIECNSMSRHMRYRTCCVGEVVVIEDEAQVLYLDYSTARIDGAPASPDLANTDCYWKVGDTIVGVDTGSIRTIASIDDFEVSNFELDLDLDVPSTTTVRGKYNLTYEDGNDYKVSDFNTFERIVYLDGPNNVDGYKDGETIYLPKILSKSIEILQATSDRGVTATTGTGNFLYDSDGDSTGDKSFQLSLFFEGTGDGNKSYESPELDIDEMLIATTRWDINNDATGEENPTSGNAVTRHISNKLTFGDGKNAEDIRVIMNAYKPKGTDIKVYAKILSETDSDGFEDKYWTELELTSKNVYSVTEDKNDYQEYEFGFPDHPPIDATVTGYWTSTLDSNTIVHSSGSVPPEILNDSVIKLYSEIFPENFGVFQVIDNAVGAGTIELNEAISNASLVDDSLKVDTLLNDHTAFNNVQNLNVVRYYTPTGGAYDTYHTVVVKTVLLSNNVTIVPNVEDYRVIGVSA